MSSPLEEEQAKLDALNDRLEKLEEKVEEQEDLVDKLKATIGPKMRLIGSFLPATAEKVATNKEKDEV